MDKMRDVNTAIEALVGLEVQEAFVGPEVHILNYPHAGHHIPLQMPTQLAKDIHLSISEYTPRN
jgi:hypothetical protein